MVNVTRKSPFTGKENTLALPISEEDFRKGLAAYATGAYIQDAFPTLSAEHREFLKTGITPEEWDAAFGPDEE